MITAPTGSCTGGGLYEAGKSVWQKKDTHPPVYAPTEARDLQRFLDKCPQILGQIADAWHGDFGVENLQTFCGIYNLAFEVYVFFSECVAERCLRPYGFNLTYEYYHVRSQGVNGQAVDAQFRKANHPVYPLIRDFVESAHSDDVFGEILAQTAQATALLNARQNDSPITGFATLYLY